MVFVISDFKIIEVTISFGLLQSIYMFTSIYNLTYFATQYFALVVGRLLLIEKIHFSCEFGKQLFNPYYTPLYR